MVIFAMSFILIFYNNWLLVWICVPVVVGYIFVQVSCLHRIAQVY